MEMANGANIIKGLKLGRENVQITHLHFTYNTLFFLAVEDSSLQNLCTLSKVFSLVSRLRINLSQSQLLGISVEDDVISEKAIGIGCEVRHWPMKYCVLPLWGNPLKSIFWEPVRRKIAKRLAGWKKAFLSRGGILTLIKSILSAIPTYYLSFFHTGVAKDIEKVTREFL